jgi:hypothetical protein
MGTWGWCVGEGSSLSLSFEGLVSPVKGKRPESFAERRIEEMARAGP